MFKAGDIVGFSSCRDYRYVIKVIDNRIKIAHIEKNTQIPQEINDSCSYMLITSIFREEDM